MRARARSRLALGSDRGSNKLVGHPAGKSIVAGDPPAF
jgi:hypothetical protein